MEEEDCSKNYKVIYLFFNVWKLKCACFFNAGLLILVVSLSWAMGFCFWLWSVPFGLVCYVSFFGSVCLGFGGFGAVMFLVFWVLSSVFAAIFFLYFWGCGRFRSSSGFCIVFVVVFLGWWFYFLLWSV